MSATQSVHELSTVLWRERELLELLTFKLEEEQLLLTAGRSRWIDHASREIEQVLERLGAVGLERGMAAAGVADAWGIPADAPLREVVAAAPEGPWGEILAAHLAAMLELTTRIATLRDENARFLRAAARATQETLAGAVGDAATYDQHGAATFGATAGAASGSGAGAYGAGTGARLFDGAL